MTRGSAVHSFDGMHWSTGVYADLPVNVYDHCMVKINDSMLMVKGGHTGYPEYKTVNSYFFHAIENKWVLGPQLIETRYRQSCGVMTWNNNKVVVVAGGYEFKSFPYYHIPLQSVEFLFLNDYEHSNISWVEGGSLPHIIEKPVMVEFNSGVILVGGNENSKYTNSGRHLYKLSSPKGTWTRLNQTMKEKRYYPYRLNSSPNLVQLSDSASHSAFLVPDGIVNCHL